MSTTSERLTANEAKSAIYDLADDFSWETVAKEMVARMSGDEARDFLSDFKRLYVAPCILEESKKRNQLMDYETFYKKFLSSYCEDVNLRMGQLFMNELCKYNPELHKKVPTDLDCYYNDNLFYAYSSWVQEHWEDT